MVDMDAPQAADRGTSDPARVDPALLDRLAARQAGHLTVWQLVMLGVARSSVTELVSRRGWTRVHRGVLRVLGGRVDDMGQLWAGLLCVAGVGGPGRATSRLLEGGDRVAALAAAVSDVAVVTGFSAGWLMGIRDNPPAVPQLLVERETQVRGRPGRHLFNADAARDESRDARVPLCVGLFQLHPRLAVAAFEIRKERAEPAQALACIAHLQPGGGGLQGRDTHHRAKIQS